MMKAKNGFRYDINCLRAIAVLAVLLFHFKVPYLDGGFVGVDVFFVISGYLMTRIILTGIFKSQFSLIDFYNRRAKRIVPELLLMIISVSLVTFFVYLPIDYSLVLKNGIASLLFYSNVAYSKVDYFDVSSDNNIFLHTWSLSVEWQFYLLLPLLLMLITKCFHNNRIHVLRFFIISTISVFILSVIFSNYKPTISFYFLPTRSWEMLLGGLAYLISDKLVIQKCRRFIAILGYAMIIISIVTLNEEMVWPGVFTLLPTIGTFLVIVGNTDFKLPNLSVVQSIGTWSYSLYLWHWPAYVILTYLGYQIKGNVTVMLLIATFAMAFLSYNIITIIRIERALKVYFTAIGSAAVLLIALMFEANQLVFNPKTIGISEYKERHVEEIDLQFAKHSCYISSQDNGIGDFQKKPCLTIDKNRLNYLLIGDSHSAHFSLALRKSLSDFNINLLHASASGCLPLINTNGTSTCTEIINFVFKEFIPANSDSIDGIILSANWYSGENGATIEMIHNTIEFFDRFGIPVLLIGQNETYTIPFTSIAAREYQYGTSISEKYINPKSLAINSLLKKEFPKFYLDIYNLQTTVKLSNDLVPYMMDQNHFTQYGAEQIVKYLLNDHRFKNLFSLTQFPSKTNARKSATFY